MNKAEFLNELRNGLSGLSVEETEKCIAFYSEMIDDRIEEGMDENEAVSGVGSIDDIVNKTICEVPITDILKERVKPKRRLRAWETVLIILGFPLWFPLLIAAGAVILSIYAVIWAAVISLWAVELSFLACTIGGAVLAWLYFVQGYGLQGISMLGISFLIAGLSIFSLFGCIAVSKGIVFLSEKLVFWIKISLTAKENIN